MSYVCDSDDGNAAAMLVTNLDTGDVLGLCGQCFPLWVEATHAALSADEDTPVDVVPTDPNTGDESDEDEHLDGANHDTDPPTPPMLVDAGDDTLTLADDPAANVP